MSAGTIKLTNGSTAIVGTSTTFTADLKSGDVITTTIGGVFYTLFVDTVTSATAATLNEAFSGPTTTGASYVAVPQLTLNRITASLATQTAESVRRMLQNNANWQSFYSGTGDISVTVPDGSPTGKQVSGPSWAKMQSVIGNPLQLRGDIGNTANINTFAPLVAYIGIWGKLSSVGATIANGFPEDGAVGMLEVFPYNQYNGMQRYTVRGGKQYIRNLTAAWNGTDGPWSVWYSVASNALASRSWLSTDNLNDFNSIDKLGTYKGGSGSVANNFPYDSFAGTVEVVQGYGSGVQQFAVSNYGNQYMRYMSSASVWSAWVNMSTQCAIGFYVGNVDNLLDDGDYPTKGDTTGLPDPALFGLTTPPDNCRLIVRTLRNNTSVTQEWIVYRSNTRDNGRRFHREKYSTNAWGEWREILDTSSLANRYGIGAIASVNVAFDWQQADFLLGMSTTFVFSSSSNPPPGVTYNTGTTVTAEVIQAQSNLFVIRVTPLTNTVGNKREYTVTISGVKGARTFTVAQSFNSDTSTVMPIANGGTGSNTAGGGLTNLGGASTLSVNSAINGFDMTVGTASLSLGYGSCWFPDGSFAKLITPLTVNYPALTASTWYYVYAYNNAGTVAVDISTTPPIAYHYPAHQKTNDASRRFIGCFVTTSAGAVIPAILQRGTARYLNNWYSGNRVLAGGRATAITAVSVAGFVPPFVSIGVAATWNNGDTSGTAAVGASASTMQFNVVPAGKWESTLPLPNYPNIYYQYLSASSAYGMFIDIGGYDYVR